MLKRFYYIVHADFTELNNSQRDEIYQMLENKDWMKYRGLSTVWLKFEYALNETNYERDQHKILEKAKRDFLDTIGIKSLKKTHIIIALSEIEPEIIHKKNEFSLKGLSKN